MIVKEICAKTILTRSKVLDYTINPYIGCEHNCTYCYARFIKRVTGHREKWGTFVDVKINSARLLHRELKKKKEGSIWISGVCDPYQPLEKKYEITKSCLEVLAKNRWPVIIQTKSPLVLRDIGILKKIATIEVGFTITTNDETVKAIFEPNSPPITERIAALAELTSAGIPTFAMIAPILPKTDSLIPQLKGKVNRILIDRLNYHYADKIYKQHNLEFAMTTSFFNQKKRELADAIHHHGIPYTVLF